jgi:hypothetical protein
VKKDAVEKWLSSLEKASSAKGMKEWGGRCGKIKGRYLYEGSRENRARQYQIFWSNIQQLQSAIYAKPPKAVVNRRYRDPDPIGRVATDILERSVNFTLDTGGYDTTFRRVRDDFLLYGRGVARVYYEPEYDTSGSLEEDISDAKDIGKGDARDSYGQANAGYGDREPQSMASKAVVSAPSEPVEEDAQTIAFENVKIRFVHRADFLHDPARTWEEVSWVAFRAFMTKDELTERFSKEIADAISSSSDNEGYDGNEGKGEGSYGEVEPSSKAAVWEIWDKTGDRVLWVARGYPEVLEEGPPYLNLDGFFPCPPPVYGTLTNDSLVPVPDSVFYQDQIEEIDQLTARIGALTDALKLVGFYPAGPSGEGAPEIELAFSAGFENKMIAVQSWAAFKEGGSGGAPVVFLPIEMVGKIIEGCVKLRQQLVDDIYQITGMSDIMRGASDPRETEGAQQLKAQFGGIRIRDKQAEVARFCRDIVRLVGQIIASCCQPSTVEKMTNIKLPTQQDVMMEAMKYKAQLTPIIQRYQYQVQQAQMSQQGAMGPQQSPQSMQGPPGPQQAPVSQRGQPPQQPSVPPPPQIPPPPNLGPTEEDVFGLIRDNVQRLFRIDIEAESTITGDESKEKQDRIQLIEAATKFMEAWGPLVQVNPVLAPLAGELLKFGTRAFRVGRSLEEIIEETVEKIEDKAKQPIGGQPDPKAQAEAIKLQGFQIKAQAEITKAQITAQSAQQMAEMKLRAIQWDAMAKEHAAGLASGSDLSAAHQQHGHNIVEMHTQAQIDQQGRVHQADIAGQATNRQAQIDQQAATQAQQVANQAP